MPILSRNILCNAHVWSLLVTFGSSAILVRNTRNLLVKMPNAFSTTLLALAAERHNQRRCNSKGAYRHWGMVPGWEHIGSTCKCMLEAGPVKHTTVADSAVAPNIGPQESVVCINKCHQHDEECVFVVVEC